MAKEKRSIVEIDFGSSYSDHAQGNEGRGDNGERAAQDENGRGHEAQINACTAFVANAQSLSDEVMVEQFSEHRVAESRQGLDWSVLKSHHYHFTVSVPPAVAVQLINPTSESFIALVETTGAIIKVGKKSINVGSVEDIDKAVAALVALAKPSPGKDAPKKKNKPSSKKKSDDAKPKASAKKG